MMTLEELLNLGRAKVGAQEAYNRVRLIAAERTRLRAMRTDGFAASLASSEPAVVEQLWNAYRVISEIDERNPGDPAVIEALEEVRAYLAGIELDPQSRAS